MEKFLYGMSWGNDLRIPADRIMISAASFWDPKKKEFVLPNLLSNPVEIGLDCGGFVCQQKWDGFPYSVQEYTNYADEFIEAFPQTSFVSVMDLPCEPDVNRGTFASNVERIQYTVRNTCECLAHPLRGSAVWLPVVQGYLPWEYSFCVQEMRRTGCLRPWMAIGSICQRKGTKGVKMVIQHVRQELPPETRLHTFGLQLSALKDPEIKSIVYSSDSGAWKFKSGCTNGKWRPTGYKEKLENFLAYRLKIEEMILGDFRYRNLVEGI